MDKIMEVTRIKIREMRSVFRSLGFTKAWKPEMVFFAISTKLNGFLDSCGRDSGRIINVYKKANVYTTKTNQNATI